MAISLLPDLWNLDEPEYRQLHYEVYELFPKGSQRTMAYRTIQVPRNYGRRDAWEDHYKLEDKYVKPNIKSHIKNYDDKFEIDLKIRDFRPEEIIVSKDKFSQFVSIQAIREEIDGPHRLKRKHRLRCFLLPMVCSYDAVEWSWTSCGVLTLTAPINSSLIRWYLRFNPAGLWSCFGNVLLLQADEYEDFSTYSYRVEIPPEDKKSKEKEVELKGNNEMENKEFKETEPKEPENMKPQNKDADEKGHKDNDLKEKKPEDEEGKETELKDKKPQKNEPKNEEHEEKEPEDKDKAGKEKGQ